MCCFIVQSLFHCLCLYMLLITLKLIKIHNNAYFQRMDPKLEISRLNCFQFNVF